jgi:hypothetical protein
LSEITKVKIDALTQMEAAVVAAAENIKHDVLGVAFVGIPIVQAGLNFRFLHNFTFRLIASVTVSFYPLIFYFSRNSLVGCL